MRTNFASLLLINVIHAKRLRAWESIKTLVHGKQISVHPCSVVIVKSPEWLMERQHPSIFLTNGSFCRSNCQELRANQSNSNANQGYRSKFIISIERQECLNGRYKTKSARSVQLFWDQMGFPDLVSSRWLGKKQKFSRRGAWRRQKTTQLLLHERDNFFVHDHCVHDSRFTCLKTATVVSVLLVASEWELSKLVEISILLIPFWS